MLWLLDYGAGNVRSLANSLERLSIPYKWVEKPEDLETAEVSHSLERTLSSHI